jgi:hypothetical protein
VVPKKTISLVDQSKMLPVSGEYKEDIGTDIPNRKFGYAALVSIYYES